MTTTSDAVPMTVYLDRGDAARLRELAKETDRSITAEMRQAIRKHLKANEASDESRADVRTFTPPELEAIGAELSAPYRTLPAFAAATGLRPEEWQALERRDVDCSAGVLHVRRTVSSGELVELAKTARSLRQVPLSGRAADALAAVPPRLDTPLLFPAKTGGPMNLDNFRRREWAPAIEAAGITPPARIYDLRSTFASRALAAGVSVFELAKVMGTSVQMIERSYGALVDGAGAEISARLDAFDRQAADQAESV